MSREAFEAWCVEAGINPGNLAAWHGYQAGRIAALEEAAEVCDQKAATIWAADADDVPGYAELVFCAAAIRAMAEGERE